MALGLPVLLLLWLASVGNGQPGNFTYSVINNVEEPTFASSVSLTADGQHNLLYYMALAHQSDPASFGTFTVTFYPAEGGYFPFAINGATNAVGVTFWQLTVDGMPITTSLDSVIPNVGDDILLSLNPYPTFLLTIVNTLDASSINETFSLPIVDSNLALQSYIETTNASFSVSYLSGFGYVLDDISGIAGLRERDSRVWRVLRGRTPDNRTIDRIIPTENEHYIIYLTNYNGQLMLAPADPIVAGTGGEWTLTVVNPGVSSTQTMRLAHVGSLNLITYMERASNLFSTQLQSFKLQFLPEHSSYFVIGINGVTDQLPNVWDFSSSINPTNTGAYHYVPTPGEVITFSYGPVSAQP